MIPPFNESGELPPGVFVTDIDEIEAVLGVNSHRQKLIKGLRRALENLMEAGVHRVWINGSFVTSKNNPNDIDGCWDPRDVDEDKLDPVLLDFSRGRAAMKETYGVDFFPNVVEGVSGMLFYIFFQHNRDLEQKGILLIEVGG